MRAFNVLEPHDNMMEGDMVWRDGAYVNISRWAVGSIVGSLRITEPVLRPILLTDASEAPIVPVAVIRIGEYHECDLLANHRLYVKEIVTHPTRFTRYGTEEPEVVIKATLVQKDEPMASYPIVSDEAHKPLIASSKGPSLHLIPTIALEAIAERFEEGVKRKPPGQAWNALSDNQSVLKDKQVAIERLAHTIHHALKLRDQLVRGVREGEESMASNASAVAWGGVFAICSVEAQ